MTLFYLNTYSELNKMYKVIQSNEGEKIYPCRESTCQLILGIYGSYIRENLTSEIIHDIWLASGSLLFLKWVMTSANSEAFTIHRDTGWQVIKSLLSAQSLYSVMPPYDAFARFDSSKEKIKFLVERDASFHHIEDRTTLTSIAMRSAAGIHLWCYVLQELKIDIHAFLEEEADQNTLRLPYWNSKTSLAFFLKSTLLQPNRDRFEWDNVRHCLRCGSRLLTFWEYYVGFWTDFSSKPSDGNHDEVEDVGKVENYVGMIKDAAGYDDDICQTDESDHDKDDELGNKSEVVRNDAQVENNLEVEYQAGIRIANKNENENKMSDDDQKTQNDEQAANAAIEYDDAIVYIEIASDTDEDERDTDEDERDDANEITLADKIYEMYMTLFDEGLCISCQKASQLMNDLPTMPGSFDSEYLD